MTQQHEDPYRAKKRGRPRKLPPQPTTISERETGMTPDQLAEQQADLKRQMYARMGL